MLEYLIITVFGWLFFVTITSTTLIEDYIESLVNSILQHFNKK